MTPTTLPPLDAQRISAIRDELGLTNTALADDLGVYRGTVGRWALGQQPPESPEMLRWALLGLAAAPVAEGHGRSEVPERHLAKLRLVADYLGLR